MSRSYKKTPVLKDSGDNKWVKRQASKSVRRYKYIIKSGSSYKKLYCSYNICDYRFFRPWAVYVEKEYSYSKNEWEKYFFRK
ncbi:MAG: hypothetical protein N4A54_05895 [Peptostreptococcaceae bacterium]|jgi:hypothetical protein|nr:hypothetical protein [Peptostreptococcaceae bacterium]